MAKLSWEHAVYQRSAWICDTPLGRYYIKREAPHSRTFRLYLENKRTKYYGTADELKTIVERIVSTGEMT